MSLRHKIFISMFAVAFIAMAGITTNSQFSSQNNNNDVGPIAGRNVNMVSGTEFPGGDPYLQRQNEPSIAVSSRNPLHLLAGANDYRSLDIPFEDELPGYEKTSAAQGKDAWVGVFKSFDGGQTWTSTLLPGFLQDTSTEGSNSPLYGYEAAADPVVRAGTNGLFYYSGIVFNRGQRGQGALFVSRFVDNNNLETGDPIEYLGTTVVDEGDPGKFIDKPWIAVDIPREGNPTVLSNNQQIPSCGNVYIVYSAFMGDLTEDVHSKLLFSMSTDCGQTWSKPVQITDAGQPYQGATIAIDPSNGTAYVAWRRIHAFDDDKPDAIMIAKLESQGNKKGKGGSNQLKFSKPAEVALIDPFDQPTSSTTFRTNCYPTMTVDDSGTVYIAWSERGLGPNGEAKIVIMTSADGGKNWNGPFPIDDDDDGYQFMPSLTCGAGKIMIIWYDQRWDELGHFGEEFIRDYPPQRHTMDVRAAQAEPNIAPVFSDNIQVSRYPHILELDESGEPIRAIQLRYNMLGLPIFGGGNKPFCGDYIDVSPSPMFVYNGNQWIYNTGQKPVFHAVWADNRDVRPPGPLGNWIDYIAPLEQQCDPNSFEAGQTGIRNQNVYTSRISEGIIAGSPGNTKPLNMKRAFVVFLRNTTPDPKDLTLRIDTVYSEADAYFSEGGINKGLELTITVLPYSSASTTVMVGPNDNEYATVKIDVYENNTLLTYVLLNPDPTNPFLEDPIVDYDTPHVGSDENGDGFGEFHTPHVGSEEDNDWNFDIVTPHVGSNDYTDNGDDFNFDWVTPHVGSEEDNFTDIDLLNPHVGSDGFDDLDIENTSLTDIIWAVENRGNTTSSYSISMFPVFNPDPNEIVVQLIVYRVYYTPITIDCVLKEYEHHELLIFDPDPQFIVTSASSGNLRINESGNNRKDTFHLDPGQIAKVIIRKLDKDKNNDTKIENNEFKAEVKADAPNIYSDGTIEDPSPSALIITTTSLPDGIVGQPYNANVQAMGGNGSNTWSLENAPSWMSISEINEYEAELSGTPSASGTYTFKVLVDDSYAGTPAVSEEYTITIGQPDLIVETLTHDPANPTSNDMITFEAVVKNIGDAQADNSTLEFLIGNELPGDSDARFSVPALNPGDTYTQTRQMTLAANSYENTATADIDDDVSESDETNNVTTDGYIVVAAGYTVSGTIYYSINGLDGVTVDLGQGDVQSAPIDTTTTVNGGQYSFSGVQPGTYWVKAHGLTDEYIGWKAVSPVNVVDQNVTRDIDLPKKITLLSPANGSNVSDTTPTLTWQSNPQATTYAIQINDTDNWDPAIETGNSNTNSYTVQTTLTVGENYTWQVDAYDSANHHVGTTQTAFTFTVVEPTYTVGVTISPLGAEEAGCTVTGTGNYHYGDQVTLTANTAAGWSFTAWTGDKTGSNPTLEFTMPAQDVTITAEFTQDIYTVTAGVSPAGAGTATPDKTSYTYGEIAQVTATANAGYTFTQWTGADVPAGQETQNPLNITMNSDKTVTAEFTPVAIGSTIYGTVMYNGEAVTNYTQTQATFWARDENTGLSFPISPTYDNTDGTYSIPNVPPGTYRIQVRLDTAEPFDGRTFPGDFDGWTSPIVVSAGQDTEQNLECQKTIHLTAPINNLEEQPPTDNPYDTWQSPVTFEWDAIGEASTYRYRVEKYQSEPYDFIESVINTTETANTQVNIALPDSSDNQHYQFYLYAYNNDGVWVGKFMIVYANGYGWDYRFRIVSYFYGVNASDDGLSLIDPVTGNVTFIGSLNPDPHNIVVPQQIAVRPSDGLIFVWNNYDCSGDPCTYPDIPRGVLMTVDPCTGLASPVDPNTPDQGSVGNIIFAPDGTLYGVGPGLYTIDTSTGVKTEIFSSLGKGFFGVSFSSSGVLYGLTGGNAPTDEELWTISTTTGAVTKVATLDKDVGQPAAIAFDAEDNLWGTAFQSSLLNPPNGKIIFKIDHSTGAVTDVKAVIGGFPPQAMVLRIFVPDCETP